ncbi:hypothetical protein LX87_02003 [Larkinella arboricola]|uniref:Uncharacterized protein n=1 Tax=Larkinella arboricola TaxID=643671 RepID=A0A327X1D9_LARAB|nr:hypothetical protein [Larkinella arboricola]RAK00301.1 hypothetical protein LX87_02003 [Larkinella arboricola]
MTQAIFIVALSGAMAYRAYRHCRRKLLTRDKFQLLSYAYEQALLGNDRDYAEAVGEAYYSALRGGRLTREDEKAIAFELAVMFRCSLYWDRIAR